MQSVPYLSLAIWTPIVLSLLMHRIGSHSHATFARWFALFGALVSLGLTVPLVMGFEPGVTGMQFVESHTWLSAFDIGWRLGIDGVSLWMLVLTAFTNLMVVVASWRSVNTRVSQYFSAFLMLVGLLNGVFASLDGMLFFIFFEATLIPYYLLIGSWGHANRAYAAVKFFFVSFGGSIFMLMAMLYLFGLSHTFNMEAWHELPLGFKSQLLVFLGFLIAFAVKVPMWPLHTWLQDVYTDGPTGAAVMLGMLKVGGYGLMRFALPIAPDASHFMAPVVIALSLFAIIYASLVALAQTDMAKMLAYSTVAHMGLVTLGLFVFNQMGIEGALVQMILYGFVAGAMLLVVGVLYDRTQTRDISAYGGIVNTMPRFAAFAMLFAMGNVGLPGTSGFVGEFMVIMGAVHFNFWVGAVAALTLILGASYTLWFYKRTIFGKVANPLVAGLTDITGREFLVLGVFALVVLGTGVYPKPITDMLESASAHVVDITQHSKRPADDQSTLMPQPQSAVKSRVPASV
jgi:NADH-quinone oxidoreductase subunit M